jgi:hypothetical protein
VSLVVSGAPAHRVDVSGWGTEAQKPPPPARQAVLDWVRNVAPDLQLGKMSWCLHEEGEPKQKVRKEHRRCVAFFSFNGERFEFASCQAFASDPDDAVLRLCETALRRAMKLLPAPYDMRGPGLEQQVIAAELQGDTAEVARLTQILIGGQPREADRFRAIPIRQTTDKR